MDLQHRPIYKWHGYWQDIGFVAVVTEPGDNTGVEAEDVNKRPR